MKTVKNLAIAVALSASLITPSFAAIEIDESEFGPSYGSIVADTAVGKPLQVLTVVGGAATWLVSYPFAVLAGNTNQTTQKLIREPIAALNRCVGCTVEEDRYYKSLGSSKRQIQFTVDGPSSVEISSSQPILVEQPN